MFTSLAKDKIKSNISIYKETDCLFIHSFIIYLLGLIRLHIQQFYKSHKFLAKAREPNKHATKELERKN